MSHPCSSLVMALRHFSLSKPVTCTMISGNLENFFSVRIKGPLGTYFSISKGDPVTFGLLDNNEPSVYGGFILSKAENDIVISPDMTSFRVERRKNTRFPLSLLGTIKQQTSKFGGSSAMIKDISYEGVRLYTETFFEVDDNIEVNIGVDNRVLALEGKIIRKVPLFGRNEYGIQFLFRYKSSVFSARENIDYLIMQENRLIETHLTALTL